MFLKILHHTPFFWPVESIGGELVVVRVPLSTDPNDPNSKGTKAMGSVRALRGIGFH